MGKARKIFAANLRAARQKLHISITELGERTGMARQYLSEVEGGKQNISLDRMEILAEELDTPLYQLLQPKGIYPARSGRS